MIHCLIIPRLLFPEKATKHFVDASGTYNSSNVDHFYNSTISPDHLNSSSQLALWLAVILYFCVVILISCARKKFTNSDIEYCLHKKASITFAECKEVLQ